MVEANPPEQPRARFEHLRKMEREVQDMWKEKDVHTIDARPGYETISVEEKNKEKFMVTFPYPYMNGFLHLGKLFFNHFRSRIFILKV